MRVATILIFGALIAAPALAQQGGAPFTVAESGRGFARLQDAVASIGAGQGTIRIAPGTYRECAVQTEGQISFVSETPGAAIFDGVTCEGKAALVLRGRGARVEGIVFRNLRVADGNGAGIRLETGDLFVTKAMFLDNQSGILSADDPSATITVEYSTFAGLGKHPNGNGAHSLYIGHYGGLKVDRCRFERGTGGHYVKSRAARIDVIDSSFDDSKGRETNYAIDLPNGASGRIAGNSFVIGPNKENYSTVITVAPEGPEHDSSRLVIEGNKAWIAPSATYGTTLVGNWSGQRVTVRDNTLGEGVKVYADR